MTDSSNQVLRKQIEEKLNRGESSSWSQIDFEVLSEEVSSQTGKAISVSTLKRFFGRMQSSTKVSKQSIEILCIYLGYESWHQFKDKNISQKAEKIKGSYNRPQYFIAIGVVIIGLLLYVFNDQKDARITYQEFNQEHIDEIKFEVKDTSGLIPFLVEVEYNISMLEGDSFSVKHPVTKKFIPISKKDSIVKLTIKKPGKTSIQLYQGNTNLVSKRVFPFTNQWVARVIRDNNKHLRLEENEIINDGILGIPKSRFLSDVTFLNFREVKYSYSKLEDFSLDTFIFITKVRYMKINGYDDCTKFFITLNGTQQFLSVPMGHASCIDLPLYLEGKNIINEKLNKGLSGNVEDWQLLKIEKKGTRLKLYRNDKFIDEFEVDKHWGNVTQLKYHFIGNGEVDFYSLSSGNKRKQLTSDFLN